MYGVISSQSPCIPLPTSEFMQPTWNKELYTQCSHIGQLQNGQDFFIRSCPFSVQTCYDRKAPSYTKFFQAVCSNTSPSLQCNHRPPPSPAPSLAQCCAWLDMLAVRAKQAGGLNSISKKQALFRRAGPIDSRNMKPCVHWLWLLFSFNKSTGVMMSEIALATNILVAISFLKQPLPKAH